MKELEKNVVMSAEHQLTEPGVERPVVVRMNPQMLMVCAHNTWRYMDVYRHHKPLLPGDEEDREFMLHEENGYQFLQYNLTRAASEMNTYYKSYADVLLNGYDMKKLKFVVNRNHVNDDPNNINEYHARLDKNEFNIFIDVVHSFLYAGGELPSENDSDVDRGKRLKFKL